MSKASAKGKVSENNHHTPPAKRENHFVFTDPLTKPQPKRQQISKACDWCRKSRIKCDNHYPCNNCQVKGRTCNVRGNASADATWTFSEAIRRIETLQDRIKDLEKQVETARSQAHDVAFDSSPAIKDEQSPSAFSQLDSSHERGGSRKNLKRLECIHIRATNSQQRHFYGRSSSFYFIGRLSSHLGIPLHQLTPDGLMQIDCDSTAAIYNTATAGKSPNPESASLQSDTLSTEPCLSRVQEEYFLNLFWASYNVYYPIMDHAEFKEHYQSLWMSSQSTRQPSALADILLAICMQYADALMPRDYPVFRTSIEGIANIDAVVTGRKFYKRCQLLLTDDELEGPSITTLQCHFFSVVYLSNASFHNAAHSHLALAIRTGVILGLHWKPSETLPRQQAEFHRRLWWTVCALELKISMDLGRPLAVDLSQVTYHPPESHQDDPYTHQGTNRFTANKHYIQLMLAGHSVHTTFQRKCSEILGYDESGYNNLYNNPEALETVAETVASAAAQYLHAWQQAVAEPLKTKRLNSGEPLSTDRSALNLKEHVPLGMSRQRLFLELAYHNVCMNIYRPFICFFHPRRHYNDTLLVDTNAVSGVNHAITITNIVHQALKESNFLAGFHEAFQWQWNATLTLIGFIAAFPTNESSLIASTRNSLIMAIDVFDIIGKYLGIACSAARVARDLFVRVDHLVSVRGMGSGPAHHHHDDSNDSNDANAFSHNFDQQAEFASACATYPFGNECIV